MDEKRFEQGKTQKESEQAQHQVQTQLHLKPSTSFETTLQIK